MNAYSGVLLAPLADDEEIYTDLADVPPCGGGWEHQMAAARAIFQVTSGQQVTLRRRKYLHGHNDGPGEVSGVVVGMTQKPGRVYLALDSGYAVDVTDPGDWAWTVSDG